MSEEKEEYSVVEMLWLIVAELRHITEELKLLTRK